MEFCFQFSTLLNRKACLGRAHIIAHSLMLSPSYSGTWIISVTLSISLTIATINRLCLPQQNKSYLSAFPTSSAPAVPLCYSVKRGKKPNAWDNITVLLFICSNLHLTFCDKTVTIVVAKQYCVLVS